MLWPRGGRPEEQKDQQQRGSDLSMALPQARQKDDGVLWRRKAPQTLNDNKGNMRRDVVLSANDSPGRGRIQKI